MSKNNSYAKPASHRRPGKGKISHFQRHRVPIVASKGKRAFKAFQYSYGYYSYKGRKRIFHIMPFHRKSFKK